MQNTIINNKILVSNIGDSDPVQGDSDGPMLHICRHFHPNLIYLLLTPKMQKQEKKELILSAIKHLYHFYQWQQPIVEIINIDTNNPARFVDFGYTSIMDGITSKHSDDQILVNISSGTQQMVSSMCLEIVTNTRNVITIQVDHPEYDRNKLKIVVNDTYDFDNNTDYLIESPNRTIITDLFSFNRAKMKQRIQSLIEKYEYKAALDVIKQAKFDYPTLIELVTLGFDTETMRTISHQHLVNFDLKLSHTGISQVDLIIKYYLQWELEYQRGKFINYILKSTSLLYAITKYKLLKIVNKSNVASFWDQLNKNDKIEMANLANVNPILPSRINSPRTLENASTNNLIEIYRVLYGVDSFITNIEILRDIEKNTRNDLAHKIDLSNIKQDTFVKHAKQLHHIMYDIIKMVFEQHLHQINLMFFTHLNEKIFQELIHV